MFRMSNLAVLIALAVGAAGGWAAASGRLDSLLRAGTKTTPAGDVGFCPTCPLVDDCCAKLDRATAFAALAEHNQTVSANLQKEGKKPNILVIWGDDIGISNISAYSDATA